MFRYIIVSQNKCQITFILHIQGVFSLPGRCFHQRVTLISSVPMTLDDVIVHVRQFIIALVSVDGCSNTHQQSRAVVSRAKDFGTSVDTVDCLHLFDIELKMLVLS